jgi:4a-hydroxytetrahydrobiopterin dehydratase
MKTLSASDIKTALDELNGWSHADHTLTKTFKFADFREAFAFLTRVAFIAEELGHHPHIENVYNTVTLSLSTHDAGNTVTEKDVALATRIQAL